jgi:hypothetical protein
MRLWRRLPERRSRTGLADADRLQFPAAIVCHKRQFSAADQRVQAVLAALFVKPERTSRRCMARRYRGSSWPSPKASRPRAVKAPRPRPTPASITTFQPSRCCPFPLKCRARQLQRCVDATNARGGKHDLSLGEVPPPCRVVSPPKRRSV